MTDQTRLHEYRVRYRPGDYAGPNPRPAPGSAPGAAEAEVHCFVDLVEETITFALPDGTRGTLDPVGARALTSMVFEALYNSLRPNGPRLTVEKNTGNGWPEPPGRRR